MQSGLRSGSQWLWLLLCLALFVPPLLSGLGRRDPSHTMEQVALAVSHETWLRAHDEDTPYDPLLTYNDDVPRVNKPPLVTWLHMLSWTGLDADAPDPDALVLRARLVSVVMGLLLLAGVFWCGRTLGGLRLAIMATLVVGASIFLQRQARTASYDIHFATWLTLAMAASLSALARGNARGGARSGKPQVMMRWACAGVFLGFAILSKNPLALPLYLGPIIAIIAGCVTQRRSAIAGVLLALLVAGAMTVPWYVYVATHVKGAADVLAVEFQAPREEYVAPWYYLGLIALMWPWPIWMIAGLIHPWAEGRRSIDAQQRRRMLIAWLWFAAIFIIMTIPAAKQQRYILPIIGAAGLLIAFAWMHTVSARRTELRRSAAWLVHLHWAGGLLLSIAFLPFAVGQTWLLEFAVQHQWASGFDERVMDDVAWWIAVPATVALVTLSMLGWRRHARGLALQAALCNALWAVIALTIYWRAYGGAASAVHPLRESTLALRATVGETPIITLRPNRSVFLNEEFRFYFGRLLPRVRVREFDEALAQHAGPLYVLAWARPEVLAALPERGFTFAQRVQSDKEEWLQLWRREDDAVP